MYELIGTVIDDNNNNNGSGSGSNRNRNIYNNNRSMYNILNNNNYKSKYRIFALVEQRTKVCVLCQIKDIRK